MLFRRVSLLGSSLLLAFALLQAPALAEESPTPSPTPTPVLTVIKPPKISGTFRYGKTLKTSKGTVSPGGVTASVQWYRNGIAITGAKKWTYRVSHLDVGKKLSVRVTIKKTGYSTLRMNSGKTPTIKHARDAKHTVKYKIAYRGKITTSKRTFRTQVNQILNDPRGWRRAGVAFKEVSSGGSMTVVLANANSVPSFSNACSSQWSCRVGRYVIINQERWKHATPTWNSVSGTTLLGYRHMVVNHETGHWLGKKHATCPRKGAKAPVMMQQSKGLKGCKVNPWPKKGELKVPRFS